MLITDPRDMPGFVAELQKWQMTTLTGVSTLFNGLLHTPGFSDLDCSRLKVCISGGAVLAYPCPVPIFLYGICPQEKRLMWTGWRDLCKSTRVGAPEKQLSYLW